MYVSRKTKEGYGLDIRMVNLRLLGKWSWRLIQEDNQLWRRVIEDKYGGRAGKVLEVGDGNLPTYSSLWWKDVVNLDVMVGNNWFNAEMTKKFGNGRTTKFWNDCWLLNTSLRVSFPRLYSVSYQIEEMVGDLWNYVNGVVKWSFDWRRNLFLWEIDSLSLLKRELKGFMSSEEEDRW
jgi:hypothetical protein